MRVAFVAHSLLLAALLVGAGCTQNPYMAASQNQTLQQQQVALQQRAQELQSRATTLDADNQELQSMLAQSRQHGKLLEDQVVALRDQLSTASSQLAQAREDKQVTDKQVESLSASTKRRGGAIITANSSLRRELPSINLPGVETRQDGDVVRIELPAAQLFQPGSAQLSSQAGTFVNTVAAEITRVYPDQLIGVEGHTDPDTVRSQGFADNQQLSAARALAVYQLLTTQGRLPPSQLFTVGHAANHPVVSNATPSGRERNNRVELVIYPERARKQ